VICILVASGLVCWPAGSSFPGAAPRPKGRWLSRGRVAGSGRAMIWLVAGAVLSLMVVGGLLVGLSAALVATTVAVLVRSDLLHRRRQRDLADLLAATRTLAREVRSGAAPAAAIQAGAVTHRGAAARVLQELAVEIAGNPGVRVERAVGAERRRGARPARHAILSKEPHLPARQHGRDVGAEVVSRLAGGWSVSARYGVPWAALIETVSIDLADRVRAGSQRDAQVSGPRVSGYVLAVLPILGVLLGAGMGADPLHVLFDTGVGHLLLLIGCCLTCAGLAWTARIVRG
jgi:tight adherence protein B